MLEQFQEVQCQVWDQQQYKRQQQQRTLIGLLLDV